MEAQKSVSLSDPWMIFYNQGRCGQALGSRVLPHKAKKELDKPGPGEELWVKKARTKTTWTFKKKKKVNWHKAAVACM